MLDQNERNTVIEQTRQLCQAILAQPGMSSVRERIDAFLGNEQARADYDALVSQGQSLQEKQERSVPLSEEEIADFESRRQKVFDNHVSRGYLEAQQALQEVRHSVNKLLSMSLESGQVPTAEEFQAATCGHGCNCH
jgi:cell fate (sporulation/competence/biofilm development) regulator YlbF (YheA/YmcA/DUF963 family)